MKAQNLNKTTMAKKMHTSRAALNRLLDENDTSLTLTSLAGAGGVGEEIECGVAGGLKISRAPKRYTEPDPVLPKRFWPIMETSNAKII